MEKQTTEQILKKLLRERGTNYLREGNYFVNAVEDLGGPKEDVRLLRYLVEVDGASALLDAGEQPPATRQTIYSQTVEKLCDRALVSPEHAHKICVTFWRAVYGEEPPVSQEPAPNPDPPPSPPKPVDPPEPEPRPVPDQTGSKRSQDKKGLWLLGWYCIFFTLGYTVWGCVGSGTSDIPDVVPLTLGSIWLFPIAKRQYLLWNQITSWKPTKKWLRVIYAIFDNTEHMTICAMYIAPIAPLVLFLNENETLIGSAKMMLLVTFSFLLCCAVYHFLWHRWKEERS